MDEITIGEKTYISSKQAAKITGYAKDYVGQLCREGRVEARLVGRNWYVLESAIREHRFGKEEEEVQSVAVEEISAPDRVSMWKKPQYEAEVPVLVPDFSGVRTGELGTPAIADMQSAWREWFEDKKALVPDEQVRQEDSFESESDDSVPAQDTEEYPLADTEEVQIARVQYDREQIIEEEAKGDSDTEELVDLRRIYKAEPVPPAPIAIARERTYVQDRLEEEKETPEKNNGVGVAVTRALLVVSAVAVALVALIGTGHADSYLAGTSLDFGIQKEVVDYLGGKSTYESSFK